MASLCLLFFHLVVPGAGQVCTLSALGQWDKGAPPVSWAKKRKSNKTSIHGMKDDERQRGKMTQS